MDKDLYARNIAELELTLNTPGWTRVIKPTLEKLLNTTAEKALDVSSKPPEGMTRNDHVNFLSGRVDGIKYVLTAFVAAVAEFESQQALERRQQAEPPPAGTPYIEPTNSAQEG